MTNSFALNHDKSLQIYFFCVKCQAKNDFLKNVESTVVWLALSANSLRHQLSFIIWNCSITNEALYQCSQIFDALSY